MTGVSNHVAMSFVHRPVVGQAIGVGSLRLITGGGCIVHVAIDIEETQVVHSTTEQVATDVEVVVVGILDDLGACVGHRFVHEQIDVGRTILGKHRERLFARLVAECHEGPRTSRQRLGAHMVGTADDGMDMSVGIKAEGKGVLALTVPEDGTCLIPLQPEVEGEVSAQENGVARPSGRCTRNELIGHLVVDRTVVEHRRDNDVLVAHVAWDDVLGELDAHVVAKAQDAAGRSGCGERTWGDVVLDDRHLIAIDIDVLVVEIGSCKGAEGVGTLRIAGLTLHIQRQGQVARCRKNGIVILRRIGRIDQILVERCPAGVAGETVLHTDELKALERTIEVSHLHREAVACLDIENGLVDD